MSFDDDFESNDDNQPIGELGYAVSCSQDPPGKINQITDNFTDGCSAVIIVAKNGWMNWVGSRGVVKS